MLDGAEFCAYIRDMFPNDTTFLAYIGRSHVAAIKLIGDTYKIYDTWDSSRNIRIEYFWVKYPERKERPSRKAEPEEIKPAPPVIEEGRKLEHKVFGIGTVVNIIFGDTPLVEIDFGSKGVKRFAESWIRENCKRAEQD